MGCTLEDVALWLLPHTAASIVFMAVLGNNRVMPVMTDVNHLLCSVAVVRTVATALVRPWGHAFKVTAKGTSTDSVTVQWNFLLPYAAIAVATVAGMIWNMDPASPVYGTPGYRLNLFWSLFNVAVLCIAIAVCVELPRRRRDERFASGEEAVVEAPDGARFPCRVQDISLGGARLGLDGGWAGSSLRAGHLLLDGGTLRLPFSAIRDADGAFSIRFDDSRATRRALIRKLFMGGYQNEVDEVSIRRTAVGVIRKIFA
jgi:cellulose synthase (UDP-forming)